MSALETARALVTATLLEDERAFEAVRLEAELAGNTGEVLGLCVGIIVGMLSAKAQVEGVSTEEVWRQSIARSLLPD